MVRAAIIGVSGYAGGELARILARHPSVELAFVSSETYAGKLLTTAFPGLSGTAAGQLICQKADLEAASDACEVLFLAQESGAAMLATEALLTAGKKVIDISADFRLRDPDVFGAWYKMPHAAPHLLTNGTAVYGLTEWNHEAVTTAKLLANPGCFPTATVLALAPLIADGIIHRDGIIVDAKSGVSGAGRAKSDLMYRFGEVNESLQAYGVGGIHRHTPEIEQSLSSVAGEPITLVFTPHLVPMTRGILATCYAKLLDPEMTAEDVTDVLRSNYEDEPFVIVREPGDFPTTKDVYGSNFCHLCAAVEPRTGTVILLSVIDNLVKGAAGQAVQNMNLMCDLPETAGLEGGGLWP